MTTFEDVTKLCPGQDRPTLRNINFEIVKGKFVLLAGQSGSGKSTFLRLILREYRPTKGTLYAVGKNLLTLNQQKVSVLWRQIGTMFQDFRLPPGKTAYENVASALQVIGKSSRVTREVVPETLRFVGLKGKEDWLNGGLSGSEQQGVAIIWASVNRPRILIVDEPTGNLDPETSVGTMKLFDRISRVETTMIMAAHDSSIMGQMRRHIPELREGELVRDQAKGICGAN